MADRIAFKPGTVTHQVVRFGSVEMPPIQAGIALTTDLHGNPKEQAVRVICVSRERIEALLAAMTTELPSLADVLGIVRAYLEHVDGMRDHARLGALVADGWLAEDAPNVAAARENLQKAVEILGRQRYEHLLHLGQKGGR